MPLYRYACPTCRATRDIFKPLAELDRDEFCRKCSHAMNRQICAPAVRGDYPGYNCPVTGDWIEGRRAHVENLAKHGCRVLEPGESREAAFHRQQSEEAFLDKITDSAAAYVQALPARQQEKLASELDAGLDVSLTRG